jgi:hypothetical protein
MVIDNFDIRGAVLRPAKTEAPLIVYPDAVCSDTFACKRFQPVSRRYAQIVQRHRDFQLTQFSPCNSFYRCETAHAVSMGELFGCVTAEGDDHVE